VSLNGVLNASFLPAGTAPRVAVAALATPAATASAAAGAGAVVSVGLGLAAVAAGVRGRVDADLTDPTRDADPGDADLALADDLGGILLIMLVLRNGRGGNKLCLSFSTWFVTIYHI
jgi:hypothetical protein